MPEARSMLERRVCELIDDVAARTSAPAGGSVAAIAVALGAALAEMAARFSDEHWASAGATAARAAELRSLVAPLAQADADAYAAVLAALRLPNDDVTARDEAIAGALADAATVPLEVARIGEEVARLAEATAARGNPNLRGDAGTAAAVAEAGARAAALLVAINLSGEDGDERIAQARSLAASAREAAARALGEEPSASEPARAS